MTDYNTRKHKRINKRKCMYLRQSKACVNATFGPRDTLDDIRLIILKILKKQNSVLKRFN